MVRSRSHKRVERSQARFRKATVLYFSEPCLRSLNSPVRPRTDQRRTSPALSYYSRVRQFFVKQKGKPRPPRARFPSIRQHRVKITAHSDQQGARRKMAFGPQPHFFMLVINLREENAHHWPSPMRPEERAAWACMCLIHHHLFAFLG